MAFLHDRFPELRQTLPHVSLGTGPTAVHEASGLGTGPAAIWIKDEATFGDGAWGGNKVRKLEWLLPDARRRGRRTILTVGGLGTNWGLATAVYAREQGLDTALALVDQPVDDHVRAQLERLQRSGATLHFTHSPLRTVAAAPMLLAQHTTRTTLPYVLPAGGSSPIGVLGYVEGAFEIAAQVDAGVLPAPSHIVVAVGSGGTAAGLVLGFALAGLPTRVVGIVVNDKLRLDARSVLRLARRTERLLRRRGAHLPMLDLGPDTLVMVHDQLGPGYGVATAAGADAARRAHERADLELEPVYTAKAMAGLLARDAGGEFGSGPAVFLQTHGPR